MWEIEDDLVKFLFWEGMLELRCVHTMHYLGTCKIASR